TPPTDIYTLSLHDALPILQRYWKSSFLKELGDNVLEIMVDRAGTMRSPISMVGIFHVHGAATRVDPNETAFGLRNDQWDYDVIRSEEHTSELQSPYDLVCR